MMRIGEVADMVGVDTPTIRYYESVGVLPEPERTPSGYRAYSDADVERLRFVVLARSLGLGLDDIRDILGFRDRGEAPCGYVRSVLDRQVEAVAERIRQLEVLSTELARLQEVAREVPDIDGDDPCVCHILQSGGTPHSGQTDSGNRATRN